MDTCWVCGEEVPEGNSLCEGCVVEDLPPVLRAAILDDIVEADLGWVLGGGQGRTDWGPTNWLDRLINLIRWWWNCRRMPF